MAIRREYGDVSSIAKLASKAGETAGRQRTAEMQHQADMQSMVDKQRATAMAMQLDAELKSKAMSLQADLQGQAITEDVKQRLTAMKSEWDLQKLMLRSQNDFALQERKYQLQFEYDMQKELKEQMVFDNKVNTIHEMVQTKEITEERGQQLLEKLQEQKFLGRFLPSGSDPDPLDSLINKLSETAGRIPSHEQRIAREVPEEARPFKEPVDWFKTARWTPVVGKYIPRRKLKPNMVVIDKELRMLVSNPNSPLGEDRKEIVRKALASGNTELQIELYKAVQDALGVEQNEPIF